MLPSVDKSGQVCAYRTPSTAPSSVVLLTLTAVKLTVLAEYLLIAAEFTFVTCFLGNEIMRHALRGQITLFEQFAHSVPERRRPSRSRRHPQP